MTHRTVPVEIRGQSVEIDEGMVTAIRWLNSLPGVETKHCCQGGTEDGWYQRAYVTFVCDRPDSLRKIIEHLHVHPTEKELEMLRENGLPLGTEDRLILSSVEVDWWGDDFRYSIYFGSQQNLDWFIDRIDH